MTHDITACRICGGTHLEPVLDLGEQVLTGVFPRDPAADITRGPLRLVKCEAGAGGCGLLQLERSYDLGEMYGDNYGYRSGLNPSMVAHLKRKVERIEETTALRPGDLVVDIGSNDSTTLQAYTATGLDRVGIDPTGVKFKTYYPEGIGLIPDFFSARLFRERYPGRGARVVTSFSMFYDLEKPMEFMREVHEILADDGVWVFEQSYMPTMLVANSYDTVCHEHLEYYALRQIQWMAERVGFRILDLEFNDVNGGSFSVSVAKAPVGTAPSDSVARLLTDEASKGLDSLEPYRAFAERVAASRGELNRFVDEALRAGKTVAALGASTKGERASAVLRARCRAHLRRR
jgi:NDP-4-keto-2,6-dideoxyhexose 3-C-methyltransferase